MEKQVSNGIVCCENSSYIIISYNSNNKKRHFGIRRTCLIIGLPDEPPNT